LRPGTSPHALRIPSHDGHPALRRIAPPADDVVTAVFGYGAPHSSARGTSTLPNNALLSAHYGPLRHPTRPGLSLASCQLIPTAITAGASRVASGLLCLHAIAITPAGSIELVRSSLSMDSGLPCVTVRSAPALVLSGPAQRSLTLRPARSPSRLATLYIESSDSFVASTAASISTGWSEPVPGRELHPLKSSAFHGALFRQLAANHSRMVSNRVMRKFLLVVVGVLLAVCLGAATGAAYILHQNSQAVTRARLLASDLQKLAVGTSD